MTTLAEQEYAALRATIRARGTARPLAALAGLAAWAATLIAVLTWLPNPIASTVPLLLLVTTFEVVRSMHLAVERIGRYIQVFFEEGAGDAAIAPPAWERTAMLLAPALPGAGGHPLFLPIFLTAVVINFIAVLLPGALAIEVTTLGVPHAASLVWMLHADRTMRRQRSAELARFRELKQKAATPL